MKILYMVIPCYNEQAVLLETSKQLKEKIEQLIQKKKIDKKSKIMFVDDGSSDYTWNLISDFCQENSLFSGVKLSRNKGHQNALLAGLMIAREKADIVISMDAEIGRAHV